MVLNFSIRNGTRWVHHCMNVDIEMVLTKKFVNCVRVFLTNKMSCIYSHNITITIWDWQTSIRIMNEQAFNLPFDTVIIMIKLITKNNTHQRPNFPSSSGSTKLKKSWYVDQLFCDRQRQWFGDKDLQRHTTKSSRHCQNWRHRETKHCWTRTRPGDHSSNFPLPICI